MNFDLSIYIGEGWHFNKLSDSDCCVFLFDYADAVWPFFFWRELRARDVAATAPAAAFKASCASLSSESSCRELSKFC